MENYPTKRAYAIGKLYKFLKKEGVYKQYALNCKIQKRKKGHKDEFDFQSGFIWSKTKEGYDFWENLIIKFEKENNEQT